MATGWEYKWGPQQGSDETGWSTPLEYATFNNAEGAPVARWLSQGWGDKDAIVPTGGASKYDWNSLVTELKPHSKTGGQWAFMSPEHYQRDFERYQKEGGGGFDKLLTAADSIVGNPLTWASLALGGLGVLPSLSSLFGSEAALAPVLDAAGAYGGEAFGAAANASGAFGGTAPSWLTSTPWIEAFANPDFVNTATDVLSQAAPGSGQNIVDLPTLFENVGTEASDLLTRTGSLTEDTVLQGLNPDAAYELESAFNFPTSTAGNPWVDPTIAPAPDLSAIDWPAVAAGWEGNAAISAAQNAALEGSPTKMIDELKNLYKYASNVSPFLKLFAQQQGQKDYDQLRNDLGGVSGGLADLIRQTQANAFPHQEFVPLARSTMLDPEARRQRLLNSPGYLEAQRWAQAQEMRKAANRGGLKAGETNEILANTFAKNAMDWSRQDFNEIAKASGMDFDSRSAVANLAATQAQLQTAILPLLAKMRQQSRGDQWNAYNSVGKTLMDLLFNDSSGGGA